MNAYYQPYWTNNENELEHFGIKGMKWGIRRYQNADGTLTEAGKKRYGSAENLQADRQKRKETAIKVAKTAAGIGAGVAATAILGVGANKIYNAYAAKKLASTVKVLAEQHESLPLEISASAATRKISNKMISAMDNFVQSNSTQKINKIARESYSAIERINGISGEDRKALYDMLEGGKITRDRIAIIERIPDISGEERKELYKLFGL